MTKNDLIAVVSNKTGLPRYQTEQLVDGFLNELTYRLAHGEKVTLSGFGTFNVRTIKKRNSFNWVVGKKLLIPAHKRVLFVSGTALKKSVNKGGKKI